jgi:hypothetical protein
MGHGRDRRRRKRRARANGEHLGASREREAVEQSHDAAISSVALTDADKVRALARFQFLHGRGGVRLSFVAFGPVVRAAAPEALRPAVIDAIIATTGERSVDVS